MLNKLKIITIMLILTVLLMTGCKNDVQKTPSINENEGSTPTFVPTQTEEASNDSSQVSEHESTTENNTPTDTPSDTPTSKITQSPTITNSESDIQMGYDFSDIESIIEKLEELEKVLSSLENYTQDDLEIPMP